MKTNWRKRSGWLLVILSTLIAAAYLRPHSYPRAARPTDQLVTNHASVEHARTASPASAAVHRSTISADGMATVPVRFQISNIDRVRTARSLKELLAQFPSNQQAKINAFNNDHFGVYRVNSPEQIAWMAANGYPMPEDIVAAEKLTDRDLLKLVSHGNDKAAFLLAERQNNNLVDFLAKGGQSGAYYDGMEGSIRMKEKMATDRLIKQSNSPYKGYLQANEAESGLYTGQGQDVVDVRVIGGLIWAEQLGDLRASQFINEFVRGNPQRVVIEDAATIALANAEVDMEYMHRSGGQRAHAAGGGIPNYSTPVH